MANGARVSPIARLLKPGWKMLKSVKTFLYGKGGDRAEHKKQIWTLSFRIWTVEGTGW